VSADWTRELLAELRAARFTPSGWTRFFGRSFAKARDERRARPRAHRQTLALAAMGLAAWAGAAAAGLPALGAAGAAWWLLVVLMADWHLGLLDERDGLGLPNVISLLRAGTPPALLALGDVPLGVALFAAAGASDVLDGALARRRGEETRLGFWLDGSVDGFVLGAVTLSVLSGWPAALVLARLGLPWLVLAAIALGRELVSSDRFVRGRAPGLVLFAGLALALLGIPGGGLVAAAGALGGLGTFAAGIFRSLRPAPAT
jgi:phosphatidylglycerophosphate synthase